MMNEVQPVPASRSFNADEALVPPYQLPLLLATEGGEPVLSATEWERRRPGILDLFRQHVYGLMPSEDPPPPRYEVTEENSSALGQTAARRQVTIRWTSRGHDHAATLLIYRPRGGDGGDGGKVPVFVRLNFDGNHSVHDDPAIHLPHGWVRNNERSGVTDHRAGERGRGTSADRWDVGSFVKRGYAVVTAYYGDFFPDHPDGYAQSVHALFASQPEERAANAWGAIGAWAWGMSRLMDYVERDPGLDERRVAVVGHSRLGKAALWAGASDQRFALVVSNNSGCGGAALSRRIFGQTVARINTSYPYWFCRNFRQYNDNEHRLPVDQHMLLALIAPRPLYVASAQEDNWADPGGEYLSWREAAAAYRLYGLADPAATGSVASDAMAAVHQPQGEDLRYHLRGGGHGVTAYDLQQFLDFADRHMRRSGNAINASRPS